MATDYGSVTLWLVILAAGVGTFLIRFSFIGLFGLLDDVPAVVERALRFVPAAVLAALVAPQLVVVDGSVALSSANPRLLAGALAALVAWRTEDVLATLVAGMASLWLLTFFFR
ncbi:AzlD domain-containing protein [Halorussus limi]|uniref:AzlD domain-containing protein n=1 Tax=Halorussus limi TaxID=2938695 RepID=A0A8U0HP77_9EURY|nr:AzlD domain-containing protein [Halorussus limi]UPV72832.1 AzlD domain-containing protein [Halorussus limi]